MKYFFTLCIFTALLLETATAQTVNQLTIVPPNPTSNDTIRIHSDFSYQGNCAYGMVGVFMTVSNDTVFIYPTYCGYGDTSWCNSIDTFVIEPLPLQDTLYKLRIEYHQGSVCPISGFDITLLQLDTMFNVSGPAHIQEAENSSVVNIWPNPAGEMLMIGGENLSAEYDVQITNALGQLVYQRNMIQNPLPVNTAELGKKGMYLVRIFNSEGVLTDSRKIVVE